jgi:hypothetical protein
MLDFQSVRDGKSTFEELVKNLTKEDLRDLTNEMVDTMLGLITDAGDEDVVFVPRDAGADDPYATNDAERNISWTLGHVVVHTTASAEESAFLAAEMARGVENHGRSRSEIPWETVTTIAQCHERLEESRRMRLASLDLWPNQPYLDLTYKPWPTAPDLNAVGRFVLGLWHDSDHVGQIAECVRQAKGLGTGD